VLWDMIIARGSQMLAGLLLYYVFRGPVVEMMGRDTVPYEKVLKMEYNPVGFSAWLTYCKDVKWKRRTGWQWFTTFMMALSTAYVLIMPTVVSAMTGYQSLTEPLLKTSPTTFISIAEIERCAFVVQDGGRIGLEEYACGAKDTAMFSEISECTSRSTSTLPDFSDKSQTYPTTSPTPTPASGPPTPHPPPTSAARSKTISSTHPSSASPKTTSATPTP